MKFNRSLLNICLLVMFIPFVAIGQEMDFEAYDPPSTLKTPEHIVTRARYPFIDVHNHQFNMPTQDLSELVEEMDKLNMAVMVNLSGR